MPKIKDFFRKFSKHKNIAPLVPGFFKEPKKEDLSLHELGMLEHAKNEYEKVRLQDKTIVSDELDFTSLFDEIRMNADLLLQDAIPTDFQQSLQRSIKTSDTVQTIKLGLYYEQISLLERQAEVLYLALKELYEKKRFLLR